MRTFDAMGTQVTVQVPALAEDAESSITAHVAHLFAQAELVFSRFRPDSELSRLNSAAGPFVVSDLMFDALARAADHARATRGIFDPTVGAALACAGYDRSFAAGELDADAEPRRPAIVPLGVDAWTLDPATHTVQLGPGVQLDLGGLVKGLTVDRAAALLRGAGAVDAGGDAVLRGAGPDGEGWLVDVEDPFDPASTVLTFRARDEAVATSAANRRAWRRGGLSMHHLIDPRTGAPADTDLVQATVVAATAERADVLAKVAFVLGVEAGAAFLNEARARAVLVRRDGAVVYVGALEVIDA